MNFIDNIAQRERETPPTKRRKHLKKVIASDSEDEDEAELDIPTAADLEFIASDKEEEDEDTTVVHQQTFLLHRTWEREQDLAEEKAVATAAVFLPAEQITHTTSGASWFDNNFRKLMNIKETVTPVLGLPAIDEFLVILQTIRSQYLGKSERNIILQAQGSELQLQWEHIGSFLTWKLFTPLFSFVASQLQIQFCVETKYLVDRLKLLVPNTEVLL